MLDLFQIGVAGSAAVNDNCGGLEPIVRIIKKGIFPIVQIGIPIVLIVLGTIDLGRAVISSDDKEVKGAQSRLIKRCIYAVAIFFVVTIVNIIMSLVAGSADSTEVDSNSWANCWNSIE